MDRVPITVEFYGIPRLRAGCAEIVIDAVTVAEALAAVERACPNLAPLCDPCGRLVPHYLLSQNGNGFVADMQRPLAKGEHLLLLSADAGG